MKRGHDARNSQTQDFKAMYAWFDFQSQEPLTAIQNSCPKRTIASLY
jgi:hypothetical protein